MAKSTTVGKHVKRASLEASIEKYRTIVSDERSDAPNAPWGQLADSRLATGLREAAAENDAFLFQLLLYRLLAAIGVDSTPAGVFAEPKMGKAGPPIKKESYEICRKWLDLKCPSLHRNDLALKVYGDDFKQAKEGSRRQMRDRCRRSVERVIQRMRQSPGLCLSLVPPRDVIQ